MYFPSKIGVKEVLGQRMAFEALGRGQYASAQLVEETATGQTFVAKCISLAALNEHDQDLAHQEAHCLQS